MLTKMEWLSSAFDAQTDLSKYGILIVGNLRSPWMPGP